MLDSENRGPEHRGLKPDPGLVVGLLLLGPEQPSLTHRSSPSPAVFWSLFWVLDDADFGTLLIREHSTVF